MDYTGRLARELHVVGLVNIQYAVKNDEVYVIEVNPRSSPYRALHQQGDRRAHGGAGRALHAWARSCGIWATASACTRNAPYVAVQGACVQL